MKNRQICYRKNLHMIKSYNQQDIVITSSLEYSLIEKCTEESKFSLVTFGVGIKLSYRLLGADYVEKEELSDAFTTIEQAKEFLSILARQSVTPVHLKEIAYDYAC